MKKLDFITHALAALMMVLMVAGALLSSVADIAFDFNLYSTKSRAAVMDAMGFTSEEEVTAYIGLDTAQQIEFARDIVDDMKTPAAPFALAPLNEKESAHMRDVRDIILAVNDAARFCMTLAAGLTVVVAWTGAKRKRRGMPAGAYVGFALCAAVGGAAVFLLHTQDFASLFVGMHELLFTNDLWLLNPQTDILIRMMPQLLFERTLSDALYHALFVFVCGWLLLTMLHGMIGGMIRRHLTKEKEV